MKPHERVYVVAWDMSGIVFQGSGDLTRSLDYPVGITETAGQCVVGEGLIRCDLQCPTQDLLCFRKLLPNGEAKPQQTMTQGILRLLLKMIPN